MNRFLCVAGIFFGAAFSLPFPAVAQTEETPTPFPAQPTPVPPGWHKPGEAPERPEVEPSPTPDPELRAVDTLPDDMVRRKRPDYGKPGIAPTLGISMGGHTVRNAEVRTASLDLWLGARFHPSVTQFGPFMAAGLETNLRQRPADATVNGIPAENPEWWEFVPEMRWGFAYMSPPHKDYVNTLFPVVELYGIAGWRIANRYDGNAMRVGFGISSPALMVLGAACEFPIPAMFEMTMDVDAMHDSNNEYAFRFGWHF